VRLPRVSIVTPSFNQGAFVEQTIRSVLLQRYPALEYIVMDGGSTDETVAILERYAPHFAHVQSGRDGGQADAIKRGFERSTGEIMGYVNSDDLLAPDALFAVAAFFDRHPGVDAVYSHRCFVGPDNTVLEYWRLPPHSDYLMKRWDLIPQETTFWRRRIYERVGGIDASFRFAMDYDLFVKFMACGRMARANRFHGAFRRHPESKTTQLMETTGRSEVDRVWSEQRIRRMTFDGWLGHTFMRFVERTGAVFAETGQQRPGNLPGLGWNYDRLWGNQLACRDVPPLHTSNAR
jgi:glycosyltransferase involved in cell wall biosynthesis